MTKPTSSLAEELGITPDADDAVPSGRIEIGAKPASRQVMDADWSPKKKKAVAIGTIAGAALALAAGVWFMLAAAPPGLPKSADEAVRVINSDRFHRLSDDRQRQYLAEAGDLIGDLSDEERQDLFSDESTRDALREIGRNAFSEMARQVARGEQPQFPGFGGRPGGRPGGPPGGRPGGPGGGQSDGDQPSEEERDDMRDRMRDRINDSISDRINSGNAQDFGLIGEMFQRRRQGAN